MKQLTGILLVTFVLLLSACAGKGALTADDVSKALQKQGLEVRELTVDEANLLAASPTIAINGKEPVPLELALPAADMAHREFLLVYVFRSEKERVRVEKSDGTPTPIQLKDLYPTLLKKKNAIVTYWSYNKDNPLLLKQINQAMEKL
ncbi:hypothetical protein [Paenibacillus sp. JDR-2]|uniref:hypothetical protein n=1 Tax=Paenibacillus sp. (strain JDR-2) TaxID=324057 RepID=UPI000166AFA9|nr:hypothetical protein [Paenibacillus sp. JDR-2]ACS99412.1 hypothetical protein Pjdr2_0733 [Paenibacillus sp. JDR-2]